MHFRVAPDFKFESRNKQNVLPKIKRKLLVKYCVVDDRVSATEIRLTYLIQIRIFIKTNNPTKYNSGSKQKKTRNEKTFVVCRGNFLDSNKVEQGTLEVGNWYVEPPAGVRVYPHRHG